MDYIPHKHGEHYDKYGKATKSQMKKIKSNYQIEESNQPIDQKCFSQMPLRKFSLWK